MADTLSLVPEEQFTADSLYGAYQDYVNRTQSQPMGYGQTVWRYGDHPDTDPFGALSRSVAASGVRPLTSNEVGGLRMADGSWRTRAELVSTDRGRKLVEAEEDIRRGNKRGFWSAIEETSWTDIVPFVGMLAKVGNDYSAARDASNFYRKSEAGVPASDDEVLAATLHQRENALAADGTWGYTFGSIVRQAPAFFLEFGLLGKAGQAARSAAVKGMVAEGTDAAAKSAATWATTRAVKTGAQEYAEVAARTYAERVVAESAGKKTFLQGVQELASNPEMRKQTVDALAKNVEDLMKSGANAVANASADWTPAMRAKVARNLAQSSFDDTLFRMSADTAVQRAWRGTTQAVRRSVAKGFFDLGAWGTDAATTITTTTAGAKRAAIDAVNQLTFGALARGTALYLPKEVITRTIGAAVGGKNTNALALEAAAWQNDDPELMKKAEVYGAFLDLLEYVSESTGRGFNQMGRAIGLAAAPGLMRPAAKVAGISHIVGAEIERDATGKAVNVVYKGLVEQAKTAEAGGKVRQFLEKVFGKRALRDNVQANRYAAAKYALRDIDVGSDVALQQTVDTGVIQPGLSEAAARAIGGDVGKFVKDSIRAANRAGLEEMKYRTYMTYAVADFLTRKNIDAIAAGDLFRTMGYDGIIAEMMEERYSDFASALFGLDARRDHSFSGNLKRAVQGALAFDENGNWKWDQLTAEAAAFAVPLVARAGTMRAIANLGGPNRYERFRGDAARLYDATRYGNVTTTRPGDYLAGLQGQEDRLREMADKAQKRYDDEIAARASGADSSRAPLDENTMNGLLDTVKRANEGIRRLRDDVKKHFMETVTGEDAVAVPVISDEELLAPAERYNLMLKTRESQAHLRRAVSAGNQLVDHYPEMCQTMFMMEDRDRVNEDAGWFRRASHWVAEHAIRLSGFAVTGDVAMLSANPARFSAADLGIPGNVLTAGHELYRRTFEQNLKDAEAAQAAEVIEGRSSGPASAVDYESIHRKTLADISEDAKDLMRNALAVYQTRLFSDEEIRDIAMQEVARQDGYVTDAVNRRFIKPDETGAARSTEEVPFEEYLARVPEGGRSVQERIEEVKAQYSRELFMMLTRGEGAHRMFEESEDGAVSATDILTVPKDLPTAEQAIVAKLARHFPQLRSVMLAREADGSKTFDDHFNEVSVEKKWWDAIVNTIFPAGSPEITADTDLEKVYAEVEKVHPAVLATVARDLNIPGGRTRAGIENRNRNIARLALMSKVAEDKDLAVFARMATDAERESRFASPFGLQSPARFNGTEWVARVKPRDAAGETVVRAAGYEEFARKMADLGYSRVNPRTVFTSFKVLQSSDPIEMIRVLGLGSEYERRMNAVTDAAYRDPLLRKNDDGTDEFANEDLAAAQREIERQKAEMFEARKSGDGTLYLRSGETYKDQNGKLTPEGKRANLLADDCKKCWFRRNGMFDSKTPKGYIAVAVQILRENGVTVPFSSSDNAFGLASQGRRGKFVISIRSAQSRGMSRNVYVPINHGSAQDYESALLESSLFTEYAKHRMYLSEVYKTQVHAFMDHVDKVCDAVATSLEAAGNVRLADLVREYKNLTVARVDGKHRLPSPSTFAEFVSAFNLFRTEVAPVWKASVLGAHAEALCAIASEVRKGTAYLGWTAVVDSVLGGTGLEVSALNGEAPKTGLGKYYALWAPKGSASLAKAVEAAHPGTGTFAQFADRATRNLQATAQSAAEAEGRRGDASLDATPAQAQPAAVDPMAPLRVAQQVAIDNDLDAAGTLSAIAEASGETQSTLRGGESSETPGGDTAASSSDYDEDDVRIHYDDEFAMGTPSEADEWFDVSDTGTPVTVPPREHESLKPSEARAAVQTFAQMAVSVFGLDSADKLTVPAFRDFLLTKIMANPRKVDLDMMTDVFREMKKSGRLSTDLSWSLNDLPDDDEEGIMPDGTEGSAQRSVDILKSRALTNWLAMFSLVSPQTGRDFQPLVEDIRSGLRVVDIVTPDRSPVLVEADRFLNRLVNPRGDSAVDSAAARDARWRRQMSWFEQASGHRRDIVRYISAYLGEGGKAPVNARAAVLLSYLLGVADRTDAKGEVHYDSARHVRLSLASLIGSCAAAQPVRLSKTEGFGNNGNFNFVVKPRPQFAGNVSLDSVVGAFARLALHNGDEIVRIADSLEAAFKADIPKLTGKSMFGKGETSFTTWAKILAPVFGYDSPLVSVFLSRPMYGYANGQLRLKQKVLRPGFASVKDGYEIPYAAFQLVDMMRSLGRDAGGKPPSYDAVVSRAAELFQAGAPSDRTIVDMETSVQGSSVWMDLFQAYASARPVSMLRAEVDSERTSKPASSLAITMPGIEPALLEFMDRTDEYGYASVVRTWFPGRFEGKDDAEVRELLADLRQRMVWPDVTADLIVAKSVSKSALSSEVLNGCETAYESGEGNLVYIPVYSGDHSSSIIIQVPLREQFKAYRDEKHTESGLTYDEVAEMVSRWVGLDLLGTDAKRSATTSMEAPGTAMWDYEYASDGTVMTEARKRVMAKAKERGKWKLEPVSARSAVHTKKDQDKFNLIGGITKFIGFGAPNSSTDKYAKTAFAGIANTGVYSPNDTVGVSVNGSRSNRVSLKDPMFLAELQKAVDAKVGAFIGDSKVYRESSGFNEGERELADYLTEHGYVEVNGTGIWIPADSKAEQGHAYVAIAWNSDSSANNEAMIGTSGIYGYGAERQREMAKDPHSSTLKIHISATGEDATYGPLLTLIKSLAVAPAKEGGRGQFLGCSPMGFMSDFAWKLIDGEESRSTVTLTDWDSIKLSQANSKTVGINVGKKEPLALMKHVFNRLSDALKNGIADENGDVKPVGSTLSGAQLDEVVGDIEWMNLGGSGKDSGKDKQLYRLSQLLKGAKIVEVPREGDFKGGRMFALVFEADNQMAFQVANVSHKAQAGFSRTPRNYMTDALAMTRVLSNRNGSVAVDRDVFKGGQRVCDDLAELVTSWGFTGAALSSQATSIDAMLADDEEWLEARDKGEPSDGDYALELRQRKFASVARRDNLAIQFFNVAAPLVTNAGWIGDDGNVYSHSGSKMFNDTLRGARTIAASDRAFFRGNKRVALANVNSADIAFRHGMYVDEERLFSTFSDIVEKLQDEDSKSEKYELSSPYRKVVAVLDHVISKILENEYSGVTGRNNAYRKMLAECLLDHHGNRFVDRYVETDVVVRDKDGKAVVDEKTGNRKTRTVKGYYWENVSYADLFTSATADSADTMEFDRTAVYSGMRNDATGEDHFYLGGTLMGLPRTPSYNGSMWLQVVRAGLPVTEIVEGGETRETGPDGKSVSKPADQTGKQWRCGLDAMIAPDPYTLAILGCDHDGDKTNIYMLKPGRTGSFELADIGRLTEGLDGFIDAHGLLSDKFRHLSDAGKAELKARVDKLIADGYLEYETRKEADGTVRTLGLRISQRGKTRVSNSFVSGLFDMNRMLPVSDDSESEVPVYDGYRSDDGRARFFGGVKAKPAPDAPKEGKPATRSTAAERDPSVAWDLAMSEEGVLGAPLLDAASGKIIGKPRVACAVQDGAATVAEARAIIVSLAGALHFAYQSRLPIGPFRTRKDISETEWVNFMYHVDGLSNMTFDDIKEQLCTRLGIRPNMIESVLADIINEADAGHLPTTDSQFIRAFVKYGKAFNDPKSARHWMARASDPADYRFQALFNETVPGYMGAFSENGRRARYGTSLSAFGFDEAGDFDIKADADTVCGMLAEWSRTRAMETGKEPDYSDAIWIAGELADATWSLKSPLNGFTHWLLRVSTPEQRAAAFEDIGRWMTTVGQLREARSFGNAINYAHVDPASNTAAAEASRLCAGFDRTMKTFVSDADPAFARYSDDQLAEGGLSRVSDAALKRVQRMRAATALMYDDSIGLVVTARGIRAAREFSDNLEHAVADYGRRTVSPDATTREALGVMAFSAAPTLHEFDALGCAANMQSVPWTLAAFNRCETLPGSRINSGNLYDVMDYIGKSVAYLHCGSDYSNVSLAARYAVEAMTDLVSRLVVNSTAHAKLHIFDFLRETPDANESGYQAKHYGPSARGLSRIRPAFERVSEGQRTEIAALWDRTVHGRELDSGSELAREYWPADGKRYRPIDMNFTMSADNLLRIHKYFMSTPLIRNQSGASREAAEAFARGISEGTNRDLLATVRELYFVFTGKRWNGEKFVQVKGVDGLEGAFGKGFAIEPSALFGQILPAYACMTSRVTGPAGTNAGSLLAIMPDEVYARLAREVARMHNSEEVLNRWADMASAVNWAPTVIDVVNYDRETLQETHATASLKRRRAVETGFSGNEKDLHAIAEELSATRKRRDRESLLERFADIATREAYLRREPRGTAMKDPPRGLHHTLSVFDGVRAVAFRSALAMVRNNGLATVRRTQPVAVREPEAPVVAEKPAQTARPEAPKPVPTARPEAPKPVSLEAQEMSDRMSALLKMWDLGRVEYNGGDSFSIYGRFHDRNDTSFATRIDVELVKGRGLYSDEQIRRMLEAEAPNYMQSLSVKSKTSVEKIREMPIEKRLEFAKKWAPIGVSSTFKLGTDEHPQMRDIGEWAIDAKTVGTLTGRIRLAKDSGDPNVVYHEFFHSVMGFLRTLGALDEKEIAALNKRYGDSARYGRNWFNEEKAAEDFRAFVEGKLKPEKTEGFFAKLKTFLETLWNLVFGPEAYGNDMERNPLAGIVLTGRIHSTTDRQKTTEKMDFAGRLSQALTNFVGTMKAQGLWTKYLGFDDPPEDMDAIDAKEYRDEAEEYVAETEKKLHWAGVDPGYRDDELPEDHDPNLDPYSRENMILVTAGRDPSYDDIKALSDFIDTVEMFYGQADRYAEAPGITPEMVVRQKRLAMDRLEKATPNGTLFRKALVAFMHKYGPKVVAPARQEPPARPKVSVFKGTWTREQVAADANRVYLFGDNTDDRVNTKHVPKSTQAVIRGLPNAIGIDTKKDRGTGASSYFTDADFDAFRAQVDGALARAATTGKEIVVPKDGIGTGASMLWRYAPDCFAYLQSKLAEIGGPDVVVHPCIVGTPFAKSTPGVTKIGKKALDAADFGGGKAPSLRFAETGRSKLQLHRDPLRWPAFAKEGAKLEVNLQDGMLGYGTVHLEKRMNGDTILYINKARDDSAADAEARPKRIPKSMTPLLDKAVADANARRNPDPGDLTAGVHDVTPEEVDATPSDFETAETLPNPTYDSDIADILKDAVMVSAPEDADEAMHFLPEDEQFACASVHADLERNLSRILPARMNRPYNATNSLAGEIGSAIAANLDPARMSEDTLKNLNRSRKADLDMVERAVALNAVRQVGSLYGIDVSDTTKVENLLFRAMNELYDKVRPDGTLVGKVNLADGGTRKKESLVTPNALASAIVTANGVRPCDILELTVRDVTDILEQTLPDGRKKYGPESTFRTNVVEPILRQLERVKFSDPTHVMYDNGTSEDTFGNALSAIRAGLKGEGERLTPSLNTDGTRRDFQLGTVGASKNPYHDDNIRMYADHVGNPDFQTVMHTVLDRLYTLQAAYRWYRQIGFEPGRPQDTVAIRGIAPAYREPLAQGEAMAALSVAPEQLAEQEFSATDYYDAPAFIAQHPDAWLDSMLRPTFGNVSLKASQQEERRQIAGFHVRVGQLDNILVRALGLDVLPGQGLTAVDRDYASRFAMESGHTVRKDGKSAIKFEAYDGKKAKDPATGRDITVDITDQRRADMTYKMWTIRAKGGRYMVTGVDGLTFSPNDSCDPAHYEIERVVERSKAGISGGYTDFDRFLLRMQRQLHDDPDANWTDVVGEDGLNLYKRVVDAACKALGNARARMNALAPDGVHRALEPRDLNDDVLRALTTEGLIQSREARVEGHEDPVRTEGTLVVSADEWEDFWRKSSTYAKLQKAGRDERTLEFGEGSVGRELTALFDDVRKFVDAHPYLSDGDGAFFHNLSTPLPWVGGDGYAMYALNRNERAKTELEKTTEVLSEYEKTFGDFIGKATLDLPAETADDNMMRLFRVLFHTREQDAEAVRQAIVRGDYPVLAKGATQKDLALAVYDRLCGMVYAANGDVARRLGGAAAIGRMLKAYERRSRDGSGLVSGGNGMNDETMYRTTGILPANHQLGHAVRHAVQGITNAFAFRSALFNMLTTPDEEGMPTCYARPADNAVEAGGLTDAMWGVVARWWVETNGLTGAMSKDGKPVYDVTATGVVNAQRAYDMIAEQVQNGVRKIRDDRGNEKTVRYGELSNSEIDPKSVTAFMARTENPEDASDLGSYAMGYAKHLFQSTRTLGTRAVTKQIHRAWAWSKALSVNFSYFFPIATRFESPIGATGFISTVGGNASPDWVRKHAELLSALQSPIRRAGWITQDFLGQKDVMSMLDSNDPYLAELYHWAGVLGIQLSDASANPMEHSRSYLQADLGRFVALVRRQMGSEAARRIKEISSEILLKGGDRAFTYHLNATKLAVVAQMCTRLQVEAARRGRAFDPVRDLKRYAAYINAEVGGIDPLQFAWAHPVMQSKMGALFFSWGWTRGAWEAGGGTALEQILFGGHDVTPEERRYYAGRWVRMFGEVMIGAPMVLQIACKAIGEILVAGMDPDDDDTLTREEKARLKALIRKIHDSPWFTWQNEDKAFLWQYNITPVMRGVTARFPSFSRFIGKDHPWMKTVFGLAGAAVSRRPLKALFLAGAAPTYEGEDDRNSTTAGREYYQHYGKQGWEELRWFQNPVKQFFSKLAMPVQRLAEGILGRSLSYLERPQPWDTQGDLERWVNPSLDGALFNLARAFIPFSVASLGDTSDAGFLSLAAPVSMGASGSDVKARLRDYLAKWSSNDRKGYAFGGMSRRKGQKFAPTLARKNVTVAHLVREAMLNGFSEKEAYRLVDGAVNSLVSPLYGKIIDALPKEPGARFDADELARLLRQANRLGRFRKDLYDALRKRLEKQQRWGYMRTEEKAKMRDILRWGTGGNAYDTVTLDKLNDKRYDY